MSSVAPSQVLTLPSDQDSTGRTLGDEEIAAVTEALRTGTLTSTKGAFVKKLEQGFAGILGSKFCHAAASGSGAIHCAVAAIDPEPGDEIVTTSITDMGALTPILYQGAIPVFADVDPLTCNVTAKTIEAAISSRTKAIIATPLFGNPCDMTGIMAVAKKHNIPVIEDCSQSFMASHAGKLVGTWGDMGCFSLQQGKHITTGEGGLVVSDNADYARRVFLFVNKAWGYGDKNPDHYFLALNYRMTELQGAVAVAQLEKLKWSADRRADMADRLSDMLEDVPGLHLPRPAKGDRHTYWKYCPHVDSKVIPGGSVALGAKLKSVGIASAPRYIQKPAFQCEIFSQQRTFGKSRFPFTLARPEAVDYSRDRFPGTFAALESVLVLPWNERYEPEHVEYIGGHLRRAVNELVSGKS